MALMQADRNRCQMHTCGLHPRQTACVFGVARQFAAGVDVLTVEIEHIDADALDAVQAELGVAVEPLPATLRIIQVKPFSSSKGSTWWM